MDATARGGSKEDNDTSASGDVSWCAAVVAGKVVSIVSIVYWDQVGPFDFCLTWPRAIMGAQINSRSFPEASRLVKLDFAFGGFDITPRRA